MGSFKFDDRGQCVPAAFFKAERDFKSVPSCKRASHVQQHEVQPARLQHNFAACGDFDAIADFTHAHASICNLCFVNLHRATNLRMAGEKPVRRIAPVNDGEIDNAVAAAGSCRPGCGGRHRHRSRPCTLDADIWRRAMRTAYTKKHKEQGGACAAATGAGICCRAAARCIAPNFWVCSVQFHCPYDLSNSRMSWTISSGGAMYEMARRHLPVLSSTMMRVL